MASANERLPLHFPQKIFLAGRNGERGPRESAARCPYTYCHGIFQVRQPVAEVSRPLLASSHPAHCCRDSLVFGSILHRLDASVRVRCRGASALGTSAKGCQEPAKRGSEKNMVPLSTLENDPIGGWGRGGPFDGSTVRQAHRRQAHRRRAQGRGPIGSAARCASICWAGNIPCQRGQGGGEPRQSAARFPPTTGAKYPIEFLPDRFFSAVSAIQSNFLPRRTGRTQSVNWGGGWDLWV